MSQLGRDALWTYNDEDDTLVLEESTEGAEDGLQIDASILNYAKYIREVRSNAGYI